MLFSRRNLPLNALRAFESTGRHCHMRQAARELGVTHGALSRQVRLLEELLGVELFKREHNRLTLTSAGGRLLKAVQEGLDRITEGALYLDPNNMTGPLLIATTASIANNWLVRLIGEFSLQYPEVEVHLLMIQPLQQTLPSEFDIAICYGAPQIAHYMSVELFTDQFFPVCSPKLLLEDKPVRQPADLLAYTLLHDRLEYWPAWFESLKMEPRPQCRNMYLVDALQTLNAARMGYGVALVDQMEVAEDLRSGNLMRLFEHTTNARYSMYMVAAEESRQTLRTRVFWAWISTAVAQRRSAL